MTDPKSRTVQPNIDAAVKRIFSKFYEVTDCSLDDEAREKLTPAIALEFERASAPAADDGQAIVDAAVKLLVETRPLVETLKPHAATPDEPPASVLARVLRDHDVDHALLAELLPQLRLVMHHGESPEQTLFRALRERLDLESALRAAEAKADLGKVVKSLADNRQAHVVDPKRLLWSCFFRDALAAKFPPNVAWERACDAVKMVLRGEETTPEARAEAVQVMLRALEGRTA